MSGAPAEPRPSAPVEGEIESLLAEQRAALQRLFPLPPRRTPPRRRKAALAGLLCATLTALVLAINPVYREESYAAADRPKLGGRLADGSQLDLDRHSAVTVRWRLRSREAELHEGRVLFSVSPAHLRPFSVEAGSGRVVVRGTQFAVSRRFLAAGESLTVQVAEGRVAFLPVQGAAIELLAGQRVHSVAGRPGRVESSSAEAAIAWREGVLIFESTPLGAALAEWTALTVRPLRAADDVAGLPLSGVFAVDRVDDFIALLPEILPVVSRRLADGGIEFVRR
jgi:transmembrane sensor